jgi:phage terminase small subunit
MTSETLENKGNQLETVSHTDARTETRVLAKPNRLTQRQETFARLYVETGVALDAYAAAYDGDNSSRNTIRVNAFRLLRNPRVATRVRELQEAAGERSLRSAASLIRDLEEMVETDPNELMRLDVGACRHCWGEGGRYQWKDDRELGAAVDAYLASLVRPCPLPAPDCSGGVGYSASREPNPDCIVCDGGGVPRVKFASTADVSPGARRLLRGIELFPDGSVKRVLLHDQSALRVELHKLRGLHIDRSVSVNVNANVPALKDMTREQTLDFLDSLKPAQ